MNRKRTHKLNDGPTEPQHSPEALSDLAVSALQDVKGKSVVCLDIRAVTDIADYMVIASGTSNRHVRALVDRVLEYSKAARVKTPGVEGKEALEWVLIDLGDVIVHVMQEQAREFYDLEGLWSEFACAESSR